MTSKLKALTLRMLIREYVAAKLEPITSLKLMELSGLDRMTLSLCLRAITDFDVEIGSALTATCVVRSDGTVGGGLNKRLSELGESPLFPAAIRDMRQRVYLEATRTKGE